MRIKETVKKELLDLSDEKYKEFHSNLCPGTDNIYSIINTTKTRTMWKRQKVQKLLW